MRRTIKITQSTYERLYALKVIPWEPFGAVIDRLLEAYAQRPPGLGSVAKPIAVRPAQQSNAKSKGMKEA